jgi:hypothetical protein
MTSDVIRHATTGVLAALLSLGTPSHAQDLRAATPGVTAAADAEDRVIGLLSLPEVFGTGPCERFTPREIALHAAPGSRKVGAIRVDTPWTFAANGGCEGLLVRVHMTTPDVAHDLPTREYAYEAPGAIVLQRRERWFKVRLSGGAAWLRASDQAEYFPLERLLIKSLTYVTEAFEGRLAPSPGAAPADEDRAAVAPGTSVQVTELRQVGDRLWVHVEVLSHSPCESPENPSVVQREWLPAHASTGEPTVWFYSRGC